MGHIHLGALPRTRSWNAVVALLANGALTPQIAQATVTAAEAALKRAFHDDGLVETVWLLLQLPLAAKANHFAEALRDCGMAVSNGPAAMELIGAFTAAIDLRLANNHGRTDLGEMAQMAGAQSLMNMLGEHTASLFGSTPKQVQSTLAHLGTVKHFGTFARGFFGRLMSKCLDYFLSRTLANQVGEGRRFTTLAQQADFSEALRTHCGEAARIVEQFSGEWVSKTCWQKGRISRADAAKFAHGAMHKLIDELKARARNDG